MGLLDEGPAEGTPAEIPAEAKSEEAEAAAEAGKQEEAQETSPDEKKAAGEQQASEQEQEEDTQPPKEDGRDKRIKQLTRRLRDTERDRDAVNARIAAREKEFDALRTKVDQLTQALEQPQNQPPGEDATAEEVREYYEKKATREREQLQQQVTQQAAAIRVEGQISALQAVHDGSDSEPSFDEIRSRFEHIIDQDPRYAREKALIQRDPNPPRKFYEIAKGIWKKDRDEWEEEMTTDKDRKAAASVASSTPASRLGKKSKLSDEDRKNAKAIFGDVDLEKMEKARADRLGANG